MNRIAFTTLGCRLNQSDTESMRALFGADDSWSLADDVENADVVVVNTCTVTARAEAESRQTIRRLAAKFPAARILATGCAVQRAPYEFAALPEVSGLAGVLERPQIVRLANETLSGVRSLHVSPLEGTEEFFEAPPPIDRRSTRAFVRVQEGCDESCAFCIVPKTRGASRSRNRDAVLEEVRRLVASGTKEVVLTGVHLGDYGLDLSGRRGLTDLIRHALDIPQLFRLRLSSLEPTCVDDELIELLVTRPQFARSLHLPLQSGSDGLLESMGRRIRSGEFVSLVRKIADRVSDCFISTDVIAGFPGETDEDFLATFELLEGTPISAIHAFSYSRRPGSPAEALGDPVPGTTKKRRVEALKRLSSEKSRQFRESLVGREVQVLLERSTVDGQPHLEGQSEHSIRVSFGPGDAAGQIMRGRVVALTPRGCFAEGMIVG